MLDLTGMTTFPQVEERSRCLPFTLRVAEVGPRYINAKTWDAFAESCGVSFRCSYNASFVWQLDYHVLFKMRRFEIYADESGEKIGQCAVGVGRTLSVFADTLQLMPRFQCLWAEVMMLLLAKIGPGIYHYGSQWNTEPPRETALQGLDGVEIRSVDSCVVQAIEFCRWSSWNGYFRHVSQNARRNAARATKHYPTLQIRMRRGLSTLLDLPTLTRLNSKMARRKQLAASPAQLLPRLLLRVVTICDYTITAVIRGERRPLAVFCGVEFGANTYYLTGGSEQENHGAAWHLLLTMIRRAYDRAPATGKFLMGPVQEQSPGWVNLARSREQCRISNIETSIIVFNFRCDRTV